MERTPADTPLQVYTSDLLLLICTFVSLTFRACRQGLPPTITSSLGDSSAQGDAIATGSAAVTPLRADALDMDDDEPAHVPSVRRSSPTTETPAVTTLPANADDDDDRDGDGDDAAAAAASMSIAAADPLRILAERLTLEEKLSTSVNWLSLVSNCLTYFLRPSQVLYTFLFTNGDFVLFVTSYSNRYQRLHAPTTTHPHSVAQSPNSDAPLPTRRTRQRSPLPLRGDSDARRLHAHHTRDVTKEEVAAVAVPPPSLSPSTAGLQIGPRHRDGPLQHGHQKKTAGSGSVSDVYIAPSSRTPRLPYPRRLFLASRPLLLVLRMYVSWCVAFGQTQLSWLLILNALLTSTLFVFHLHHLFFFLGTLFGYLAAVASLFLCGMEMGSIVVRLQRRYLGDDDDDDGDVQELHVSAQGSAEGPDRDILGGINGPHWAFVGEHLSAAACSVLYVWMLLEEGDALWSSHIDLMRWYVCSCALMTLSLMKCLRVVF